MSHLNSTLTLRLAAIVVATALVAAMTAPIFQLAARVMA